MTIPLSSDGKMEVSVFLSFDFDQMADDSGLLSANDLVNAVIHGVTARSSSREHASHLSEHPLTLGSVVSDSFTGDDGRTLIKSSHKIGGQPFFLHGDPELESAVEAAYHDGFRQLVQLAFPGGEGDAEVSGDWPFADGLFHLLARNGPGNCEFLRFWEY